MEKCLRLIFDACEFVSSKSVVGYHVILRGD